MQQYTHHYKYINLILTLKSAILYFCYQNTGHLINHLLWSIFRHKFRYSWIAKSFYICLATPDEVEKYAKIMQSNSSDNFAYRYNVEILSLFDLEFHLINTKLMVKKQI